MNFLSGQVEGGALRVPALGEAVVATNAKIPGDGTKFDLGLRPQEIVINTGAEGFRVELTEELGGVAYVYLSAASGERVVVEAKEIQSLSPGAVVGIDFDPTKTYLFDASTEQRIH